jgi:hypothetical protein
LGILKPTLIASKLTFKGTNPSPILIEFDPRAIIVEGFSEFYFLRLACMSLSPSLGKSFSV